MKSVIKALLAASMLMPIAAQAQDQDGRERGQGRRSGEWGQRADRPQRSAEVGVDAQVRTERPQRAEFRAERQQPAPEVRQEAQPGRGDGRNWNRQEGGDRRSQDPRGEGRWNGERGTRNERQQADTGRRRQAGNDWRQPDRDDRSQVRPDGRDGGQRYRQPGFGQDDRRAAYGQNRDWRGDGRSWDGRDQGGRNWNDGRRYDARGGAWNRGWRNDNRYDWNRYREVNRSAYRLPRYYAPSGWGYGYRRFSVGVSLSSILFSQNYWIDDPFAYRLPEAYGPYRWVRYYDDALLVDVRSGQVVDTVYDIFN